MAGQLRILVVIASYGLKNLRFLHQMLAAYRSMPFAVRLVVVSESPKDLGEDVEVIVGLPTRNPWTLPFAHKRVMAERADDYDLFVYSEDDIGIGSEHIHAFLDVLPHLEPDEIPGFMRYEVDASGRRFMVEPWGHYHWKPDSARARGPLTVAEFTNEHAGFYVLTRDQLQRAIASGGFLLGPRQGRYQWPETAATDPYTVCGFRKVICISHLEHFLVHHMPNPYVHQLDVPVEAFKVQIDRLMRIRDGEQRATTLCNVESPQWFGGGWGKGYYEKSSSELLRMVRADAQTILSIGCGWGETEARLMERGAAVTALPLDSVIGAVAEGRDIPCEYGSWHECMKSLRGRQFDCVLLTNLLHLQKDPAGLVKQCAGLVAPGGDLVLAGPNLDRLPWRFKRVFNFDGYGRLGQFELSGHSMCVPRTLKHHVVGAGFRIIDVAWLGHTFQRGWMRGRAVPLGSLTARDWMLRARRSS